MHFTKAALLFGVIAVSTATPVTDIVERAEKAVDVDDCPGYVARNVKHTKTGLTAELRLAGKACNAYGKDIPKLKLEVSYDTGEITTLSIELHSLLAHMNNC